MLRAVILIVAALLPAAAAAAQESVPAVTLTDSVSAALSGGDDVLILRGNLDLARAQYQGAVAKNSLTLAASGSYGASIPVGDPTVASTVATGGASSTGFSQTDQLGLALSSPLTSVALTAVPYAAPRTATAKPTSSLGLTVSQTLWNGYPGGTGKATVDKSLIGFQGKELSTESGKLTIAYNVKQAYYTMLSAQRALDLKKQIVDRFSSLRKQMTELYDSKLASTLDLKTAQYNARSAEIDVESADRDLRVARVALSNIVGWPADKAYTVADAEDPKVPADTVEAAVADGLGRRVELKQLDLSRKSNNVDLAVAKGQATPTVTVTGGAAAAVDWSGKTGAMANASVRVAMPILDAGSAKSALAAVAAQNAVYSAQEDQLKRSITAAVRSAWANVQIQKDRADLAAAAAETSDLQYRISKTQFDSGTASNQDLMTASVNLANAQAALESARSAAQLAVLQLQSVMGY
jgi:outer membrane protein TolC